MASPLAGVFSAIDSKKRALVDALRNPRAALEQKVGDLNDRARAFNELTAAATQEAGDRLQSGERGLGDRQMELAQTLADSYNMGGVVVGSLSKTGNPREAGAFFKDAIKANKGKIPFEDVGKMTKEEFDKFYDALAPHHQGKFDRLLRGYAPMYDDLPTTMKTYATDFKYENPRLVSRLAQVQPDDLVPVYRSVTKADPDVAIVPGDWIALERAYAAQHGRLGGDAPRMMQSKVPAKDIRWAGTSADEYFYVPSENVNPAIQTKYDALIEFLRKKK
jgi:hypothetical protein